jgi:hypothetical protein
MTGNKATLTDEQRERIFKAVMSGGWAAGFHALVEEAVKDTATPEYYDALEGLVAASGTDKHDLIDTIRKYLTVKVFYDNYQRFGKINSFYDSAKALNDHYHLLDSEVTQLLQPYKPEIIEPLKTFNFPRIENTECGLYYLIERALVALAHTPDEVGVPWEKDNFMSLRTKDGKVKLFYVLEESGKFL